MVTTRAWAMAYARLGWRVFPVVPGEKRPMYRGWQRDATTHPHMIERYWRQQPVPNIGVVAGESFDAFDIEAAHLDALAAQLRRIGAQRIATPIARTGRGGLHVLTKPTGRHGSRLHLDGVHVGELKSVGGFIVACPSATTGRYGWLRSPLEVPLVAAPSWLIDLTELAPERPRATLAAPIGVRAGAHRLGALERAVQHAPCGTRNSILYWAMRRALEEGIPGSIAASVLGRTGRAIGLAEREVDATIRSALDGAAGAGDA